MIKCTAECPHGIKSCCLNCYAKEVCPDVCVKLNPDCEYAERTPFEDRHARKFWRRYIVIIAVLILITAIAILFGTSRSEAVEEHLVKIPAKVAEIEEKQPLTAEERELIERVVAAEARGESLQGQMAVAQTIKDRSDLWGMTPAEAVLQDGQYASPYQGEISDSVHLAVANVFDGGVRIFEEPTTHFAEGEPYWAENKVCRGLIESHKFYY